MSFLQGLNDVQREAATHKDGPALIIAGPGSGKTRVLTFRIAWLIQNGVDPFNILALTFTNKAAGEMRERIEHLVGTEARNLFMGTFHSIFARLLRVDGHWLGYPANFTIYDTDDSKGLIKSIVKEMGLNDKLYKPNVVLNRISSAKNSLITPELYLEDPELTNEDYLSKRPELGKIYQKYCQRCFTSGAMDFDDLLLKTNELLEKFPQVLYKYQNKFQYVLIDEYQDTNFTQYAIVKKLAAINENIVVVGDDAQSIYAFRGATIQNILNFEKDYPDLSVFKLEQNYRSTKNIVSVANHVIANNKEQLPKTIWTGNDSGERIKLIKAVSDNEEGKIVADLIFEQKMRQHIKNNDVAILYRTNAQSRSFEEALRRLNIPYVIYGGLSFYQRKEVKDLIAYLRIVVNPHDEEALKRIINYPTRGIGKTTVEKLTVFAAQQGTSIWDALQNPAAVGFASRTKNSLEQFVMMIKSFQTMLAAKNAFDLASHIARSTGILKELHNDKTVEGLSRYENLQELLNGIKEFTEQDVVEDEASFNQDRSLGAYLQNITLLTSQDQEGQNQDTVKLMTIHAAKGLEFDSVFIAGLEEQLFPSFLSLYDRDDLEEERRLFYVAVTRAKRFLSLSYAATRYRFGNLNYCEPSRFLEEVPDELMENHGAKKVKPSRNTFANADKQSLSRKLSLIRSKKPSGSTTNFVADNPANIKVGQQVEHQRFGVGEVTSIEGNVNARMAVITFHDEGVKKVMLKFAKLKILSDV